MPDRLRVVLNRNVPRPLPGKCHLCSAENLDLVGRVSLIEADSAFDHPVCATCQESVAKLHRWIGRGSAQPTVFQLEVYGAL